MLPAATQLTALPRHVHAGGPVQAAFQFLHVGFEECDDLPCNVLKGSLVMANTVMLCCAGHVQAVRAYLCLFSCTCADLLC